VTKEQVSDLIGSWTEGGRGVVAGTYGVLPTRQRTAAVPCRVSHRFLKVSVARDGWEESSVRRAKCLAVPAARGRG
jgi:hypothetical protein